MKAFALVSILMASGPAVSQCTIFLAPPEVKLFMDQNGRTPWPAVRSKAMLAFPAAAMQFLPTSQVKIHELAIDEVAGCDEQGFRISKKTGFQKLWVETDVEKYIGLWADPKTLIRGSYDRPPAYAIQNYARNIIDAKHGAAVALDAHLSASFKPPDIANQCIFSAPFEPTWAALIEALSDRRWAIESVDKASGLITTKFSSGGADVMACATFLDRSHRVSLSVFVKAVPEGTRIKVNTSVEATREGDRIVCYSNGKLESSLFGAVEKNLP